MTDKTIIIGGGLIGLTTGYELARRGLDVQVIEAREDVGLESSYANGGILVPSGSFPWNGPKVLENLPSVLFDRSSDTKFHFSALSSMFGWMMRFLRNSTTTKHKEGMEANFRLASYSTVAMAELRERLNLNYDAQSRGTMKIFRSDDEVNEARDVAEMLQPLGLAYRTLDRNETVETEPLLSDITDQIAGGLLFPDDESGDALIFCGLLADEIRKLGGTVTTEISARGLETSQNRIITVVTDQYVVAADQVVVCAGNWSPRLVKPFGIKLPIGPVKGYSVTIDGSDLGPLPQMPIMDDAMHGNVVTLGNRLRLAGIAEFAGMDRTIDPTQIDHLFRMLEGLFPRIAASMDRSTAQSWAGLRPVSANGTPYIGTTAIEGLWINAGHGHVGWTMAAGSARLIADLIHKQTPEINAAPYRIDR